MNWNESIIGVVTYNNNNNKEVNNNVMSNPDTSSPKAKGILSFITGPSNQLTESFPLHYVPNNPSACRMRKNLKRKSHNVVNNEDDIEEQNQSTNIHDDAKRYNPLNAEFTLLFFCDLNCMNSRRFTFILADFMKECTTSNFHYLQSETKNDRDNVQLILIPNNENISILDNKKSATIMSHLQSQTDYWYLGFDHMNRLAIIRYVVVDETS